MGRQNRLLVGMGVCVLALWAHGLCARAFASGRPATELLLLADMDDDDADGRPDGVQSPAPQAALRDARPLPARLSGARFRAVRGEERIRLFVGHRPLPWGAPSAGRVYAQGLSAGTAELIADKGGVHEAVHIVVGAIDIVNSQGGRVDPALGSLSPARSPPVAWQGAPRERHFDDDGYRFVLKLPRAAVMPKQLSLESVDRRGSREDTLVSLALHPMPCPEQELQCASTVPVRPVFDDVDRQHPLLVDRSIRVSLGGAILVRVGREKALAVRILGPLPRPSLYRAHLRVLILRAYPGGAPAVGGTDAGALAIMRAELSSANTVWSQCGITFGDVSDLDIRVVNPPPPHLLALGTGLGLPSQGSTLSLRVDGMQVHHAMSPRQSPHMVAAELGRRLQKLGFVTRVSTNARGQNSARATVDVSVRRRDGRLSTVELLTPQPPEETLRARVGVVDLSDGLSHFTDVDAVSGTLEERTLVKGLEDNDPTTIDVLVVPSFAGAGRIGESFIASDRSSLRNVVIMDRGGIRARGASLTLAHELGHVLLDMPGHPDDYGSDTPTELMDSDASDPSAYGPRRISLANCRRAVLQSGPSAPIPLLVEVPVAAIPVR